MTETGRSVAAVRADTEPDDDFEPGWPPAPPPPPTERFGLKVGDSVMLVAYHGTEYPAEVVGFNSLPDDIVVRWTGVAPSLDRENTVCRSHLREVRLVPRGETE